MRILFCGRPAYGHLYPLLPLAFAARAAGHTVVFATGADFVGKLAGYGFDAREAGISVGAAEAEATRRHPNGPVVDVLVTMFADVLPRRTMPDVHYLLSLIKPDLVVYEMSDVGAAGAARRAGVPCVSVTIGRSMPAGILAVAEPHLNWIWNGRPPADPMLGDAVLDFWPASIADPAPLAVPTRFPIRPVPWSPPGRWESPGTPLVYLTLGTVSYGKTDVFRAAIEGLAGLPVQVVVAVGPGDPSALGSVPSNVRIAQFVPQDQVLRDASVVVHHGGSGTTLGAAAHGLPQLILPQGADQFVNAEVISAQGSGLTLAEDDLSPGTVAACALALLGEPVHRATAQVLRDEIAAMPSPADALEALQGYVT
ncbi:glycosyltransferase [Cryptosporangium phraense]|uniref:Glycosyltransferase family 1 protein n=1 Tax=Cryptosporangium phraense TaxID=2593070 RepID=A0A545B036_9ACTN|nr:glycosyltransferase [Cryptosporangium phraense]TQS46937.1 glycosyltransferase family 1 protein [Cryptosporangium phraense]